MYMDKPTHRHTVPADGPASSPSRQTIEMVRLPGFADLVAAIPADDDPSLPAAAPLPGAHLRLADPTDR